MKSRLKILMAVTLFLVVAFFIYVNIYYPAGHKAKEALVSDDTVVVQPTADGYFFDGASTTDAFVFYPGGKVDCEAYAPLLRRIAQNGPDVFLIDMPFRLAIFDQNAAERVMAEYEYPHWYVGGHSLGGAMAAKYAAEHGEDLDGVILLAAYPIKPLDEDLTEILIYGTRDGVINRDWLAKSRAYAPRRYIEHAIAGGNHAYFGDYGEQKGDERALISADFQQEEAAVLIDSCINGK